MKKYKYKINNLDCANCARKIQESLNKNPLFKDAIVNFNTSSISFYSDNEISLSELNKIVKSIEPDSSVIKNEIEKKKEFHLTALIIGIVLFLLSYIPGINKIFREILIIFSYIILLYKPFLNAIKLLINSKSIDENALIVISCMGAYFVDSKMEGIMVIVLYTIGKILENKAINNTRKSINDITKLKVDYANKKVDNNIEKINVNDVKVGDILVIKKGEQIPVDGLLVKGSSYLDTSSITGESKLLKVTEKDNNNLLSGYINTGSVIEMQATSSYEDSLVFKILELLDEATDKKTKTETFVSRASKIYTPIVLLLALLVTVFLPLISNITYNKSIYRALTFLVISCPCAIAISIPLSYFTGIGVSSKNGVLVKGSNYLEQIGKINKIIFDKTGTLTTGTFNVTNIELFTDKYTKEEIIDYLVKGESLSNHPIAKSILRLTNDNIDSSKVKHFEEVDGKGITYTLANMKINVGNKEICACKYDALLHVNINGEHVASITLDDGIKDNAKDVIKFFKDNNIKAYMFTGDKKDIALKIGNDLQMDEIKYEMLPDDKYKNFESVKESNDVIAYVGDGVNDAPILKRADIGVSLGGTGSSSAIDASDIVLMNDDLSKLPVAIKISKYTSLIIKENLIFAFLTKISILILSVFGIGSMWAAVFADTGVTLLTILNTLRIMYKFKK